LTKATPWNNEERGGLSNSTISGRSHLELSNGRFENNLSLGDGGAIYTRGEMLVSGCTFNNNHAGSGGVIASSFSKTTISGSSFINN